MNRKFSIIYLGLSLIYLAAMNREPFVASWLLKIAPLSVIFYLLVTLLKGKVRLLTAAAVLLSMSGDILLNLDFFIPGLASFLVAQVFYSSIFVQNHHSLRHRWPLLIVLVLHLFLMAYLLTPVLEDLWLPVMAYLVVIGTMGVTAVMSNYPTRWLVVGAFIFVLSDSLIATNKFLMPFVWADGLIMSTYYMAQLAILYSLLAYHRADEGFVEQ